MASSAIPATSTWPATTESGAGLPLARPLRQNQGMMLPNNPPSRHASVSASLAIAVLLAAERLGLARDELLSHCALDPQALRDPDGRIPFAQQQRLWQAVAERLPVAEPGLAIGAKLGPGQFSVLGYLLQSSPTFGAALQAALRYQRLAGEGGTLLLERHDDELQLIYRPLEPGCLATRTRVLALMHGWLRLIRPLLGALPVRRIELALPAPADPSPFVEAFAAPLRFAAPDFALVLPAELERASLTQGNAGLQQLLQQHADNLLARLPSESLGARVVALLSAQLAQGEPDRSALATHLGLSERTLQRRLAEEGSSYQQLLTDIRRQLAERYLDESALPATEIAILLGYSEPSVFFRAFRQWTGLTPGEYRSRHAARG